jgi:hypothetical protein
MRLGSMSPPKLKSLDEAGEPLKDGVDGDLGGSFLPHRLSLPPPAPPPPPGDNVAATGGSGRRLGLSGAPAKQQRHLRARTSAAPPTFLRPRLRGAFAIAT